MNTCVGESDAQRVLSLANEAEELRMRLFICEHDKRDGEDNVERLTRLQWRVNDEIEQTEREIDALRGRVRECHQRLTQCESVKDCDEEEVEKSSRKSLYADLSVRERELHFALSNAREERDSAMQLLLKLLGRESSLELLRSFPSTHSQSHAHARRSRHSPLRLSALSAEEKERCYNHILSTLSTATAAAPTQPIPHTVTRSPLS